MNDDRCSRLNQLSLDAQQTNLVQNQSIEECWIAIGVYYAGKVIVDIYYITIAFVYVLTGIPLPLANGSHYQGP